MTIVVHSHDLSVQHAWGYNCIFDTPGKLADTSEMQDT